MTSLAIRFASFLKTRKDGYKWEMIIYNNNLEGKKAESKIPEEG